jgi:ribonuclease P protein component
VRLTRRYSPRVGDGVIRVAGIKEAMGEANLPAEQPQASQTPRVPPPHVNAGRSGHHQGAPSEGPAATIGLTAGTTARTTKTVAPWRIRDRRTFSALRRAPRSRCGPVTVSFIDGDPAVPPRAAYAVGRKVGGAVERNRLRRRLRAIVGQLASELRPGAYLFSAAPEAADLSVGELRSTVIRAIEAGDRMGPTRPSRPPRPEYVE